MNTTVPRKSRKPRKCSCGNRIGIGDMYVEHTTFPGDDSGYADDAGHPVRIAECRPCAERYGRSVLFDCTHENISIRKRFSGIGPGLTVESVRIISARCIRCGKNMRTKATA